jgi:Cu/Ag efflux protein CusF
MTEIESSDEADMSMEDKSQSKVVSGNGVIKVVLTDDHKLNLQHEPIEDIGWPAMTMDFAVADDVDISGLSVDDKVMFQLEEKDDRYRITSVHVMNEEEM